MSLFFFRVFNDLWADVVPHTITYWSASCSSAAIQGRFGSGCVFRQIQRLPSSLEVLPPTNPPPTSYTSSRNRTGHQAFYWPIKLSGGVWLVETEGRRLLDGRGEGGAAVRDLWEREAEGGLFTVPLTIDTRWLKRSIINLFESWVLSLSKSSWPRFVVHINSKLGMVNFM